MSIAAMKQALSKVKAARHGDPDARLLGFASYAAGNEIRAND